VARAGWKAGGRAADFLIFVSQRRFEISEDATTLLGYNGIDGCVSAGGNLFLIDGLEGWDRRSAAGYRCPGTTANDVAASPGFQHPIDRRTADLESLRALRRARFLSAPLGGVYRSRAVFVDASGLGLRDFLELARRAVRPLSFIPNERGFDPQRLRKLDRKHMPTAKASREPASGVGATGGLRPAAHPSTRAASNATTAIPRSALPLSSSRLNMT
jgi:hypothetical protein